jgi:outer membrane protein assembly factor BamB
MARRITPARFPRGVADPSGEHAYLRDQAGGLVALDLGSGKVLWRAAPPMRPLLARDGKIVAARPAGAHALEIVVLDAADGKELRRSKPLALPDWVNVSLEDTPNLTLHAEEEDGTLILRWAAQNRYRGGAAPSPKVLEAAKRDAAGAARVDLTTGRVEELSNEEGGAPKPPSDENPPSSTPDVLEQRDLGDKAFQLLARKIAGGTVQMLVRALDPKSGRIAWETIVDEALAQRPKPPRP